jgi:M6 family metalloprotease-like protein
MKKRIVLVSSVVAAFALSSCTGLPPAYKSSNGSSIAASGSVSSASSSNGNSSVSSHPDSTSAVLASSSSSSLSSSSVANSSLSSSSASTPAPSIDASEDKEAYASKDVANAVSATIDTTSNAGYKYGRDIFYKYTKYDAYYDGYLGVSNEAGMLPTTGTPKMLVVPCIFSDSTKTATEKDTMRGIAYRSFFGDASTETGWQSVRSYYYESSYHQLYLEGKVSPVVKLPYNEATYNLTKNFASGGNATDFILDSVYTALFTGDSPIYNVSDFDSDGDGTIDGIFMLSEGSIDSSTNVGWAFTTRHGNEFNTGKKALGIYGWAPIAFSSSFIKNTASSQQKTFYSTSKPDAHTFIHESGHVLGLDDYYDYDSAKPLVQAGGPTMQDLNICDHESFSKYLWGWTSPKVVTENTTDATITYDLNPFEDSGDTILIASHFNDTALDEYLLIDYYTPTGLNFRDTNYTYESSDGFSKAGIRIWHANKAVHEVTLSGQIGMATSEDPNVASYAGANNFLHSFTTNTSTNYSSEFILKPELEMMRRTYGTSSYNEEEKATDSDLFVAGDTFGAAGDNFSSFAFYDTGDTISGASWTEANTAYANAAKYSLPYSISVVSIGTTAKITLTKKA